MTIKLYESMAVDRKTKWLQTRDNTSKWMLMHITAGFYPMGASAIKASEIEEIGTIALAHGWKVEIFSERGKHLEQFELPNK